MLNVDKAGFDAMGSIGGVAFNHSWAQLERKNMTHPKNRIRENEI
jgi:hypothetical protein